VGIAEFIKPAGVFIEHQHVAVTVAGLGIAFDQGVGGDRHRPGVVLAGVGAELDTYLRLASGHYLIGIPMLWPS